MTRPNLLKRRPYPRTIILAVVALALAAASAAGSKPPSSNKDPWKAPPAADIETASRVVVISENAGGFSTRVIEVGDPASASRLAAQLRREPGTLAAGRAERRHTFGYNDPEIVKQWGYTRLGGSQLAAAGTGDGIVVAVLDTGVDAEHPELRGRVLPGWDPISGGDGRTDPNGHGTHVAGIIAAAAGNNVGIAGLAPAVRILPVRVLGADGYGDDTHLAQGILWSVENGAHVINMSLGGAEPSDLLESAISTAVSRGVTVIAAAGNYATVGNAPSYPAAYPQVLAVGATDPGDRRALYSNTGAYIDIVAPGSAVYSLWPGARYQYSSGTSMAAPFVSAAAALVAQQTGLRGGDISRRLTETALDLGAAGRDHEFGAGLLDPLAATGVGQIDPPGAMPQLPMPTFPPDMSFPTLPELLRPTLPQLPVPNIPTQPTTPNRPSPNIPTQPTTPNRPSPNIPTQPTTPNRPSPNIPTQPTTPNRPSPNIPTQPTTPNRPPGEMAPPASFSALHVVISGHGASRTLKITLLGPTSETQGRELTISTPYGTTRVRTGSGGVAIVTMRQQARARISISFTGTATLRAAARTITL